MTPRAPRHRYDVSRCPDYQGGANRLSANQYVSQEWVMDDDQVNAEELAESKRRREAMQNATDDGMPFVAEIEERDAAEIAYRKPKQRIRRARKWLGAGSGLMPS
jgi:thiamine pyrophosphokinase